MSLVSRYEFQKCVDRYKGDWRTRSFTCFDQFKVMSFALFTDRSGLRDIEMTLEFCGKGLYHAGLSTVPKSTLAEANEKKWVKQHLHIKKFYGTSENAVYLQLWIAVCDYLLLIIAKKRFCLPQTLHTISNSIGPLLFNQDDIHFIFNNVKEINNNERPKPQYVEGSLF